MGECPENDEQQEGAWLLKIIMIIIFHEYHYSNYCVNVAMNIQCHVKNVASYAVVLGKCLLGTYASEYSHKLLINYNFCEDERIGASQSQLVDPLQCTAWAGHSSTVLLLGTGLPPCPPLLASADDKRLCGQISREVPVSARNCHHSTSNGLNKCPRLPVWCLQKQSGRNAGSSGLSAPCSGWSCQ